MARRAHTRTPFVPAYPDTATLCAHLCISDTQLDALVRRGELPPPKRMLGGKRIWKWTEVVRCIEGEADLVPASPADEAERIRNATRQAAGGD